jgi:hypothetical protein
MSGSDHDDVVERPKEWFARNALGIWLICGVFFGVALWQLGLANAERYSLHIVIAYVAVFGFAVFGVVGTVAWCGYFERKGRDEARANAEQPRGMRNDD